MLVSSTNFTVGMHLCMGDIQEISLFSKADGCIMERLPPCHKPVEDPCCEDETVVHEAGDFKTTSTEIPVIAATVVPMVQAVALISEVIPSAPGSRIRYYNYDPPLRTYDLTVEHQVFLI